MTNLEERFKKAEVEKPAPVVNRIKIPTYEKTTDSDEVINICLYLALHGELFAYFTQINTCTL